MRAIILSAGQGRRLLPLTRDVPKCLLEVHGPDTLLDVQLRTLAACGVHHASVMVGFGADRIEDHLARHPVAGIEVRTRYNPFYSISDNLVTAWLSRSEMKGDFLYLNGDTLFDPRILEHLVQSAHEPITLAVNRKRSYDDDDMRVALRPRSGGTRRLEAVGKRLPDADVDGESIGLMLFRGGGGRAFHDALEWAAIERRVRLAAARRPEGKDVVARSGAFRVPAIEIGCAIADAGATARW